MPRTALPAPRRLRIGVFDSGVGGLSVLRAIRGELPQADLLYVADTGHAPYGDKTEAEVLQRTVHIAGFLLAQGADLLVIACNTATAAAVAEVRSRWPGHAVVGVEPGIKPAVALAPEGVIAVLATTRTLASEKFRRLAAQHAGRATLLLQPCPGLVDAIEGLDLAAPDLAACVERYSAPLREAGAQVAVLGCTHYPFVARLFNAALPGVTLVDTGAAVARQTARLAAKLDPVASDGALASGSGSATSVASNSPGTLRLWSSGSPAALDALDGFAQRWLGPGARPQSLPA